MKVLDLFSGIGGFSLGLSWAGFETVAFCEIEEYPRKILARHWPGVPIHKDIRELDGTQYRGTVDVICGGFPCQPFSLAGKRTGKADDRDLWPEMFRVIREVQPAWVIGENVAGFVNMELDRTLSDLESAGYACQTFDIPAVGVDAKHIRHRVWIVANASGGRCSEQSEGENKQPRGTETISTGAIPDTDSRRPHTKQISQSQREGALHPDRDGAVRHVAKTNNDRQQRPGKGGGCCSESSKERHNPSRGSQDVANSSSQGLEGGERPQDARQSFPIVAVGGESFGDLSDCERGCGKGAGPAISGQPRPVRWEPEPGVGRVVNGLPGRVDRIKGLGNSVVPQIPHILGDYIMAEHMNQMHFGGPEHERESPKNSSNDPGRRATPGTAGAGASDHHHHRKREP